MSYYKSKLHELLSSIMMPRTLKHAIIHYVFLTLLIGSVVSYYIQSNLSPKPIEVNQVHTPCGAIHANGLNCDLDGFIQALKLGDTGLIKTFIDAKFDPNWKVSNGAPIWQHSLLNDFKGTEFLINYKKWDLINPNYCYFDSYNFNKEDYNFTCSPTAYILSNDEIKKVDCTIIYNDKNKEKVLTQIKEVNAAVNNYYYKKWLNLTSEESCGGRNSLDEIANMRTSCMTEAAFKGAINISAAGNECLNKKCKEIASEFKTKHPNFKEYYSEELMEQKLNLKKTLNILQKCNIDYSQYE